MKCLYMYAVHGPIHSCSLHKCWTNVSAIETPNFSQKRYGNASRITETLSKIAHLY